MINRVFKQLTLIFLNSCLPFAEALVRVVHAVKHYAKDVVEVGEVEQAAPIPDPYTVFLIELLQVFGNVFAALCCPPRKAVAGAVRVTDGPMQVGALRGAEVAPPAVD
jgi:hypothetical protein